MTFSSSRFLSLITLLLALFSFQSAFPQVMTWEEKRDFSDSINTIKVWTYIQDDPGFRYFTEVIEEVTYSLNRKGYVVVQIHYDTSKHISIADWLHIQLISLKKGEALLTIPIVFSYDSVTRNKGSKRNLQVIQDQTGGAFATHNINQFYDVQDTLFYIGAEATLYTHYHKTSKGVYPSVYSRGFSLERPDINSLINKCFSGIPRCRNSIVTSLAERPAFRSKVPVEITGYGGFFFSSSRKTEKGNARFAPNFQYGVSLGFGLTKAFDFVLNFRRETTGITMNIPDYADSSAITYNITYLTFGGECNFRIAPWVSPFLGLSLGAVNLSPRSTYYREVWYFAITGEVGSKFYLNKWLGLRIQADLFSQVHPKHAPFLYAPNTPVGIDDAMSNMLQLGFSGGIIFRF
ncbi:MAG: hypothetical protein ISS17_06115 [Bacteroidales bacterium]|nr:hypothetical protein [Bacteroidales bacterium]